jgi:hypothetical protein
MIILNFVLTAPSLTLCEFERGEETFSTQTQARPSRSGFLGKSRTC